MNLQEKAQKWGRKTANAGGKWKANTTSGSTPCRGLQEKYGVGSCSIDGAWQAGVSAVSASDFDGAVRGKEQKWLNGFLRGIAAPSGA